ncbi:hypothetical protein Ct61P_15058 [Colletotrichum tofieldiae]|nr:hypothetical protein Ct61P_15058 [Colletotrichum tofieldiae]
MPSAGLFETVLRGPQEPAVSYLSPDTKSPPLSLKHSEDPSIPKDDNPTYTRSDCAWSNIRYLVSAFGVVPSQGGHGDGATNPVVSDGGSGSKPPTDPWLEMLCSI